MPIITDIMNAIRAAASAEYAARVPDATEANIAAVSNPILTYQATQNEFLTLLVNKIALQLVHNRTIRNPLAVLKKGGMPLGRSIEEIFSNPAVSETFDGAGTTLLAVHKPDTKTLYHSMNRQDVYTVTINDVMLRSAFTSWEKLQELIESITATLYSGDNYDEFILAKKLMQTAIESEEIVTVSVADPMASEANAKSFVKALKTAAKAFQFPGSSFNKYKDVMLAADPLFAGDPVITWTPKESQILILRSDVSAAIDTDVLAHAFNLGKVELETMTLEIDAFGEAVANPDVYAILADKAWFQIYDNDQTMNEFYNPKGRYWNYFYHHWQTYSISHFANAIAFMKAVVVTLAGALINIAVGEAGATQHTIELTIAGTLFTPAASVLTNWTITGEAATKVAVTAIVVSPDKTKVTVTTTNSAAAVAGSVTMIPKAAATDTTQVPAAAFTIATVA